MTSVLRDALSEGEFRERYILRRLLCEDYMKNINYKFKYNTVSDTPDSHLSILKGKKYIQNIKKKVIDDWGFYDYLWKKTDNFSKLFDSINDTQGVDIEYDNGKIIPLRKGILEEYIPQGMVHILKIGFPKHFIIGIIERKGNILYFSTADPSGLWYNKRNLSYECEHRTFQFAFRKWISERSVYRVYFQNPHVNICFQYMNDSNCQTWVYYYIHIVYIDKYTSNGKWVDWLQKLKSYSTGKSDIFDIAVYFNMLLDEFIQFITSGDSTIFTIKYPLHYDFV